MKRALVIVGGVLALWLALLVVLGVTLGARQERQARERLAEPLQAEVTLGDVDLALVRGHFNVDKVVIRRDDAIGHLALTVDTVRCELLPLGLAIIDRDCRELAVRGVRLEVSTAALFTLTRPPRQRPVHAESLVVDDATIVFMPSAILPGVGSLEIALEHAEAGPTTLRTPLSWLFSLEQLRARLSLPAGITLVLEVKGGVLRASGSLLGSQPVELPFELPVAATARDAHEEMLLLVSFVKKTAERLITRRAEDWLKSKL